MYAPSVAMWTLAALASLDLAPEVPQTVASKDKTSPAPKKFTAQSTPAKAELVAAVANPEATETLSPKRVPGSRLNDLKGHWAQPFVEILQAKGIVQGFDDGNFRPDQAIAPKHLHSMVRQAMIQHGNDLWVNYANSLVVKAQPSPLPTLLSEDLSDAQLAELRRSLPLRSPTQSHSLTRAEAALFVYQALAQVDAVPPPKMPKPPQPQAPSKIKEAKLPTVEIPAKLPEQNTSESEKPGFEHSISQPIQQAQQFDMNTRPPKPRSPQPEPSPAASPLPTIEIPQVAKPSPDPSQPASVDVPQQPAVRSNLGDLVTGDRAQPFNEYWYSLCVANPTDLQTALAACDRILAVKPKEAKTWAIRAELLMQAKDYPEAVASLERVLALQPPTSALHTRHCQALSELGKQAEALAACEAAITLDKDWGTLAPAIAWFAKGTALKRMGRNEEALETYEKALVFSPSNSEILTEQCRVQSELGQQAEAIATCGRALDFNQNWGDRSPAIAWLNKALALTRANKLPEAVAAYDKALEVTPKDPATWTQQGMLLAQMGQHATALAAYDQALKISPNFSLALLNRGAALNRLGKSEEALAACDQAIGGDERWGELGVAHAWDQRGVALAGLNRMEEAIASADRALSLKPDFAEAYSNRAVTLWRMEDYEAAIASVDESVKLKPRYSQGWFNKGRILRSMKKYEAAIAAYDEALKGDVNRNDKPTLTDIWVNRSAALWQLSQYPEALDSANRAVEINPKSAIAWYNRGVALLALNQPEEAIKSYNRAVKLNPEDAYAWTGQGMALEKAKKYEAAIAAFDKALALKPDLAIAQQSREAALKRLTPKVPTDKKEAQI
ncbi:MAG TPA: tetratricopeptide repeat protein [Leptolyngbyaceae cyanobacterium M33_DOE_097]|nr:tetratricopeptide repeat protein [Leptolyngbyaceae cyanobacterium M33_DOE_097]